MGEGEGKKEVCKHNQTGFCEYGERCRKQHVNIKCNQDECKDKKCSRRQLESEQSILNHITSTHKQGLKYLNQNNDESEDDEGKQIVFEACNDAGCFRLGENKCLCFYE